MLFQNFKIESSQQNSVYSEMEQKQMSNAMTPRFTPSLKSNNSFVPSEYPKLNINLADQIDTISIKLILDRLKPSEVKFSSLHINKIKNLLENPTYKSKSTVSNRSMISTFYFQFIENSVNEDEASFYDLQISKFLYNSIQNSLNNKNFHKRETLETLLKNVAIDRFEFLNTNIKSLSYDIPDLSPILERHLSNEEVAQVITLLVSHFKANLIELIEM